MVYKRTDPVKRFLSYVEVVGDFYVWTGGLTSSGYGKFWDGEQSVAAHLWLWRRKRGPVPDGLVLDHYRCSRRTCVRLDHLRPVTPRENLLRSDTSAAAVNRAKTHCPQNHPYDEANTYVDEVRGLRSCRICRNAASLRYYHRRAQRA